MIEAIYHYHSTYFESAFTWNLWCYCPKAVDHGCGKRGHIHRICTVWSLGGRRIAYFLHAAQFLAQAAII